MLKLIGDVVKKCNYYSSLRQSVQLTVTCIGKKNMSTNSTLQH